MPAIIRGLKPDSVASTVAGTKLKYTPRFSGNCNAKMAPGLGVALPSPGATHPSSGSAPPRHATGTGTEESIRADHRSGTQRKKDGART